MRACFTMQLREKDKMWLNLRNYHPFCPNFKKMHEVHQLLKSNGKVVGLTNENSTLDMRFKGQLNSE